MNRAHSNCSKRVITGGTTIVEGDILSLSTWQHLPERIKNLVLCPAVVLWGGWWCGEDFPKLKLVQSAVHINFFCPHCVVANKLGWLKAGGFTRDSNLLMRHSNSFLSWNEPVSVWAKNDILLPLLCIKIWVSIDRSSCSLIKTSRFRPCLLQQYNKVNFNETSENNLCWEKLTTNTDLSFSRNFKNNFNSMKQVLTKPDGQY